ncbi:MULTISPECIES: hypothetical protein [unclassified Micromonospora]|uniref:hypothetical protein n=1 Tax=unclassified Micromonospora TaxID=2617518 RepID=UPI00098D084A|nr:MULTISPECIES: hypothetical protein [unclassified Micromonospora]MDI5936973.1 hypothetical protein [Micromonospora sp. DH15]OON30144.1 hypothetical protein BSA16_17745 [Micromonospora sp. Rc5]
MLLTIAKNPIPDLSVTGALDPYAEQIEQAFGQYQQTTGEELAEHERQAILAQLVTWSGPEGKESFPSWPQAVRAAQMRVKTGGFLGERNTTVVKSRNEGLFNMAMGSVNWANCGKTAENILSELKKKHPTFVGGIESGKREKVGSGAGKRLLELLREVPPQGQILLLDCTIPFVHTFLLEVHPNGNRYLCQGYQGAYYASWWTGKDEGGLLFGEQQDNKISNDDRERLSRTRDDWGLGRSVNPNRYDETVVLLAEAFDKAALPDIGKGDDGLEVEKLNREELAAWDVFAKYWLGLPFCPVQRETDSIARRTQRPEIEITRILVPDVTANTGTSVTVPVVPNSIKG